MRKFRSVQALRAVAACSIVVLHSYGSSFGHMNVGRAALAAAGVDLFFVISGFIMATISAGKTPAAFLSDRVWRIYPIWLIAAVPWIFVRDAPLITTLTLWPVLDKFYVPALGIGWTLSFEMLFYVAMTVALAWRAWLPIGVFAFSLVMATIAEIPLFDFIGCPIILEFLLGVAIAKLPKDRRFALPLIGLGLLCFGIAPAGIHPVAAYNTDMAWVRAVFWGVPAGLIVYGALSLENWFSGKWADGLVLLGNASYSIYLFHLAATTLLKLHWIAEAVLATALGLAVYATIERPIMQWRLRSQPTRAKPRIPQAQGQ